jgi:1-acyl-sn-glycerol-3-phosphate acyltransferase
MDVIAYMSHLGCSFVAKKEIEGWPALGRLAGVMDTIFIDRTTRRDVPGTVAAMQRGLASGLGLVIFPEGTSSPGAAVSPFKPALLELAARSLAPVFYASVSYRSPDAAYPASAAICCAGDVNLARHLYRLLQLPHFHAELTFGPAPVQAADRKVLAHALWSRVSAQFTPVSTAGDPVDPGEPGDPGEYEQPADAARAGSA